MALEQEIKQEIITACMSEQYEKAADLLVGDSKEDDTYIEVVAALKKIGSSITGGVVANIYKVYKDNEDSVPVLQGKFDNIISSHVVHKSSSHAPENSAEVSIDEIKPEDLDDTIARLRRKQNDLIRGGKKPDQDTARHLTALIARKQNLEDADHGAEFKKKSVVDTSTKQKGAGQWFVLPDSGELDKYEVVRVVVGSPMIDVLRERYEQEYKVSIRDDFRDKTKELTVEGEFEKKKELDKERTFADGYKDTDAVEDQDIYVSQIASRFITDQYDVVEPEVDAVDKNKKYYNFAKGRMVVTYNRETKTHNVSIEGDVPGAATVSIKRRTDSGRIIDDAYDMVEFRDSRPVAYAKSSKGNVSLRNEDEIRRALNQSNIDLGIPSSAVIGDGVVTEDKHRKVDEHKDSEEIKSPKKAEEVKSQDLTPPASEEKLDEELVPPKPEPQVRDGKTETQDKEKLIEPKMAEPKSEHPSMVPPSDATIPIKDEEEFKAAGEGDAGFLRSQLIAANAKETSQTTKNYLAAQIAEAEGKSLDAVKKEFDLSVSNQDKNKQEGSESKVEQKVESVDGQDATTTEEVKSIEDIDPIEKILDDLDLGDEEDSVGGQEIKEEPVVDKDKSLDLASEIMKLKKQTSAAEIMASKTMDTLQVTLEVVNDLTKVVDDIQQRQLDILDVSKKETKSKIPKEARVETESLKATLQKLTDLKKKKTDPKSFKHPAEMSKIKDRLSKSAGKGGSPDDPAPLTDQSKSRD